MKPSLSYKPLPGSPGPLSLGLQRHIQSQNAVSGQDQDLRFSQVALFLLLHLPLLLIFRAVPLLAMGYSVGLLLLGLHFIARDPEPIRAACLIAYIAGAEILWRGAEAAVVWEYGKYATLLLCVLMTLRYRLLKRGTFWPFLFVALLVPGIFVAPAFNRQDLSYQLAGPVALAVVSWVFSSLEFKRGDLQRLFLAMTAPTVGMGFLVLVILLTQNVTFYGGGENEAITGGIGANQVASALSVGAMAAFYYAFVAGNDRRLRYLMILVALALVSLSVLTFSRAGLWNTAAALAVGLLFLMQDLKRILRTLAIILTFGLLAYFVGFPLLNNLTGGAVVMRFTDFDSTGRDVLARIDYEVFLKNPIWGVGVGQSPFYHVHYFGYPKPTHTEYSRLLAEHGSFGVAAIVLLAGVTLYRLASRRPPLSKGISTAFTIWALIYMTHSATRMVAPSFVFGLAAARFLSEEEETHD